MATAEPDGGRRRTQAERRARTRAALLEAAARGLSRYGYANLMLDRVAREAGYTRGALYHLFANKEELALAVVRWVDETWSAEVGRLAAQETDPVEALLATARGHAVYCRRDVARVMMTLRVEFAGQDHPVGRLIEKIIDDALDSIGEQIAAARAAGSLPPGPPPRETARAYVGAVEGIGILLAGHAPHDAELIERAVRGVLGLPPTPTGTTGPGGGTPAHEAAAARGAVGP
ncbi:TetR/AcrR family transcriptional regulator [Streptomyces coeruleoprunus]|uniref:TetR/AcrR family transcriptional regulator n=1 Tax=Streptomyces coeruleoprunus TaxID=285563 RepID=A0ABV9XB76_9ACTN